MSNNSLIVYWSPAGFKKDVESWNLLYREPNPIRQKFVDIKTETAKGYFSCPSVRLSLKNLFALSAFVEDEIVFEEGYLQNLDSGFEYKEVVELAFDNPPRVRLRRPRASSFKGYANVEYNYQWLFVAEEPCVLELTAPYLPPKVPAEGAIFAGGEFDIGQWFRLITLDYHIPLETKKFHVKENDELAYVKFKTEKNVVFKRFTMSAEIFQLSSEMAQVASRYGRGKGSPMAILTQRYQMAKKSKMRELLLSEIKKNLID